MTGHRYISESIRQQLDERQPKLDLTARELQILELIAMGKNNQEIAATLRIGESTVKWFVGRIYLKLNARDRAEAISLAVRRGVVYF